PTAAPAQWMDDFPYQGGAFALGRIFSWLAGLQGRSQQRPEVAGLDMEEVLAHRPLNSVDEVFGRPMPIYQEFLQHPTLDDHWKAIQLSTDDFNGINIPSLTVTGSFDQSERGAMFSWRNMRAYSPAKESQYLLVGPWSHGQTFNGGERKIGELEFTGDSIYDT